MEPFMGEVRMFGGNYAPPGWATCDGQSILIAQNDPLFLVLGTNFGGFGTNYFNLPDFRGRVPVHIGQGPGLSNRVLGQIGGSETTVISVAELPSHNHGAACNKTGDKSTPAGNFWGGDPSGNQANYNTAANVNMSASMIGAAGLSGAHNNLQPFLCVTFIICVQGIKPA